MSNTAIILIIISAFIHAWWNFISKRSAPTPRFFLTANTIGAFIFLPWLFLNPGIVPGIPGRVWALLFLTGLFQALYLIGLAAAYRHGDLSISYPVSRSLPVIFVPLVTVLLGRGGLLGGWFIAGAILVLTGGALVSLKEILPLREKLLKKGVIPMAVAAAAGTTGYSILDDRALRILRGVLGESYGTVSITLVYTFLEAFTCALWIGIYILLVQGNTREEPVSVRTAAFAGALMYLTYGLVLLAMAYARDISLIVAFRQVSIPAGALMGFVFLRESAHIVKVAGLIILFTGLAAVALS